MNIIIFSLTILGVYGILRLAYRAWKIACITEEMDNIEEVEKNYEKIVKFNKEHKSINKKKETVENFRNGEQE